MRKLLTHLCPCWVFVLGSLFGDKGILIYAGGQGGWGTSFAATHQIEVNDGKWHFVAVSYSARKEPHLTFYVDRHRKHPVDDGTFMGGDFLMRPDATNSVLRIGWARRRPAPLEKKLVDTVDTLGRARQMLVQQWAWLIGMTDVPDARLLEWARSYANPPKLEITGGQFESHVPHRRANRISVEANKVGIRIKPTARCVNPAFELLAAPKAPLSVKLSDRPLRRDQYAWDGRTLWLNTNIDEPTVLELRFGD